MENMDEMWNDLENMDGRKVTWKVKRYGKYGGKVSWIVKRYGKYGKKASWIVRKDMEKRQVEYWNDMENM